MDYLVWAIVSAGIVILVGIIVIWRILQDEKGGSSLQEGRVAKQEFFTLGNLLVVLGIVFGGDRLISYSFIGVGVLLSVIGAIKSRRKDQRASLEAF